MVNLECDRNSFDLDRYCMNLLYWNTSPNMQQLATHSIKGRQTLMGTMGGICFQVGLPKAICKALGLPRNLKGYNPCQNIYI